MAICVQQFSLSSPRGDTTVDKHPPQHSPRTHLVGRQAASAVPESVGSNNLEAVDKAVRQSLHIRLRGRPQSIIVDVHRGHGLDVDVRVGRGGDHDVLCQRVATIVCRRRPPHRRLREKKIART